MTQQPKHAPVALPADAHKPRLAGSQRTRRAHAPVGGQPAPPPRVPPEAISSPSATPEQRRAHWGAPTDAHRIEDAVPSAPNLRVASIGAARPLQPAESADGFKAETVPQPIEFDHECSSPLA
jgi:hypothetical protein